MEKKKITGFLGLALVLCTFLPSFTPEPTPESPLQEVKADFIHGLQNLNLAITNLHAACTTFDSSSNASIHQLRTTFQQARLAYKNVEFLVDYIDPQSAKYFLNGPPLPNLVPNVPKIIVQEPQGFQIIEELIFEDTPPKTLILEKVNTLVGNFNTILLHQKNVQLQDRFIFEAARNGLIRLFTLGLTGFDTPASGEAINEGKQFLAAIAKAIRHYYPSIQQKNIDAKVTLESLFEGAYLYLEKHADFDSFDRLEFLRKFLNPLYAEIHQVHKLLQIEYPEETNTVPFPVNYHAENLFAQNFFNDDYYSRLAPTPMRGRRAALGKLLFFDPVLSANNERSCASCHNPALAFTDGKQKSLAINGKGNILRNAPTLINCIYTERFFYDLREPNLERQILHVVKDSLEFNTDFVEVLQKLAQSKEYMELFQKAYPEYPAYSMSKWSVSDALANYVASLKSFNSPFDRYARAETEDLAPEVKRGFNLFMGKAVCGTCHFAPAFNGANPPLYKETDTEVIGVPISKDTLHPALDPDLGRYASLRPEDEAYFYQFSFKTPTVRNIELTAPYMHNGVYDTLEEVVDFYNKGGGQGLGIKLEHQTLPFDSLNLNKGEISDIIAFMKALTDTSGLTGVPATLPLFDKNTDWNNRQIGGIY